MASVLLLLIIEAKPAHATIDKMYIVPLTHLDIGFTAPPDDVADECKARIDQVLGYLDTYPRFKWNIESYWQLEQWLLRTSDQALINKLFDYVNGGRVAIGGGFANMHSSMLGPEEANRLLYSANRIRNTYNVDIQTMFMDDVPGWSWSYPQVMAKSGIMYFVTAPNTFIGGAADIPMSDRPFYYEGPDGSRVLTWRGYSAYLEGSFDYNLHGGYGSMETAVLARIADWEAAGYPYDAILILDGTGDNGMASRAIEILDNVDWWNANHSSQMIIATAGEFFEHMEATYPASFPVYAGDSAGFWDGINTNVPVSQGWVRGAADRILSGEKAAAINYLGGSAYPDVSIDSVYHEIHVFDEHSGAGTGWPGLETKEEIDRSNLLNFETAERARRLSESVLDEGMTGLLSSLGVGSPTILVFNSLSWTRTDLVRLEVPQAIYNLDFVIRDAGTLQEIPHQKAEGSIVEFIATDVPPTGYRLYYGEPVDTPPSYPDRVLIFDNGRRIENDFYSVSINASGLSILDKDTGRELVNQSSEFLFNGLTRAEHQEDFFGISHVLPFTGGVRTSTPGPISGEIDFDFNSYPLSQVKIILYSDLKRIDLVNTLDRSRMRYVPYARHSDHYYLSFPFNIDVSSGFQARVENPNKLIRPDLDYLTGAFIGNMISQHAIDLREASGFGVTVANRESFLNEIGSTAHMNTSFTPAEATILNKLNQNADQGDTADQGIVDIDSADNGIEIAEFHHSITSSQVPPDSLETIIPADMVHFGWSFDLPLEATFTTGTGGREEMPVPTEKNYFSVSNDNVVLVSIKKSGFNSGTDIIFRLQEISGIETAGVQIQSAFTFLSAELNSTIEEPVQGGIIPANPITFDIGAYETITIRAR